MDPALEGCRSRWRGTPRRAGGRANEARRHCHQATKDALWAARHLAGTIQRGRGRCYLEGIDRDAGSRDLERLASSFSKAFHFRYRLSSSMYVASWPGRSRR
jgi:hypothetical protein